VNTRAYGLTLALLLVICFCSAARLDAWYLTWQGNRAAQPNMLGVLMGDSRRMFANHFFIKADAYFHSGYYPSIFDDRSAFQTAHVSADSGAAEERNVGDAHDFLNAPLDAIESFSRHFFPSQHTHLGERDAPGQGEHGADDEAVRPEMAREILPWLQVSVALDPQRVETYVVAAFWLSEQLGKVDAAESFLWEGLRENPQSYEILFELGRLYDVHRHDPTRARNLWQAGVRLWRMQQAQKAEPDYFFFNRLTDYLAALDEREGRLAEALEWREMELPHATQPDVIRADIERLRAALQTAAP
jgi:hypothetical protein